MKNKIKLPILVVIFFYLLLTLSACSANADKTIEKVIGSLIEAENEAILSGHETDSGFNGDSPDEDIDEYAETDSQEYTGFAFEDKWPSDIPDYVPQILGDISGVMITNPDEQTKNYTIGYENIKVTDKDYYINDLESKGWSITSITDLGESWIIQASYDDQAMIIMGTVDEDKSGMMNLTLY